MSTDDAGQAWGRGSIGRIPALIALVLAPLIAYLIVRAAMAALGGNAALATASLPPADYREAVRRLSRAVLDPRADVDRSMVTLAHKAATAAPLLYQPYMILAQAEYRAGHTNQAIALAEEARRRRPSQATTRLMLVLYYMEAKRVPELLAELDMTLRLSPEAQPRVLPELAKLLEDSEGRKALIPILAERPAWRRDFYAVALSRGVSIEAARAIYDGVGALTGGDNRDAERQLYIESLLAGGEATRARELWLASMPGKSTEGEFVFDGTFRGLNASPPFNWVLMDADVGRAEPASRNDGGEGLDVTYFGGREAKLADQRLALPAGRYRLLVTARSVTGIKSGELAWLIVCDNAPSPVVKIKLDGLQAQSSRYSQSFTMPQNCKGQHLIMSATPGDTSAVVEAHIASVKVRRDG